MPQLDAVRPGYAELNGVNTQTLSGQGLSELSAVQVGTDMVSDFVSDGSETVSLTFSPTTEGVFDLDIENPDSSERLENGLMVFDPTNTSHRVLGAIPARVRASDSITVVGGGFTAATTAQVSGQAVVVSLQSPNRIELDVPNGLGPGQHTVRVQTGGQIANTNIHIYRTPIITTVTPDEGMGGGTTAITITGTNFRDIEAVSYTHLTLPTTPYV